MFNYIFKKLILSLCFTTIICLILGEFVGISFEQIRFIADNKVSVITSIIIHVLAIPKFLLITCPYGLLMANIFTYRDISMTSEIIALRSFGIGTYKIIMPSILLSVLISISIFLIQELVSTEANYAAANILENTMNIDRLKIEKNDFIYSEFEDRNFKKDISLLLYAEKAGSETMKNVTVLTFDNGKIREIFMSNFAFWNPKDRLWLLKKGVQGKLDDTQKLISNQFDEYIIKFGYSLNQILTQARDNDELNIIKLREKLNIFRITGHKKEVRQLETILQARFTTPFNGIVFSAIGAAIGINLKQKAKQNEFTLGLIIILFYYVLQAVIITLIAQEFIPARGIWIPSLLGINFALFKLVKSN